MPGENIKIDEVNFPDEAFRTYAAEFDEDPDGILSQEERANVTEIRMWSNLCTSLKGIEYFPNNYIVPAIS